MVLTPNTVLDGGNEHLECTLEFEYAWDTPDCPENGAGERTLRICMFYCEGNDPTCWGSCKIDCRQISVGNGAPQREVFRGRGLVNGLCHYCHAAVFDVTGNESCNDTACDVAYCSTACGHGVLGAKSDCDKAS